MKFDEVIDLIKTSTFLDDIYTYLSNIIRKNIESADIKEKQFGIRLVSKKNKEELERLSNQKPIPLRIIKTVKISYIQYENQTETYIPNLQIILNDPTDSLLEYFMLRTD